MSFLRLLYKTMHVKDLNSHYISAALIISYGGIPSI